MERCVIYLLLGLFVYNFLFQIMVIDITFNTESVESNNNGTSTTCARHERVFGQGWVAATNKNHLPCDSMYCGFRG